MLLAHAGEEHLPTTDPETQTETHESTGEVLAATDQSSNGTNYAALAGGIFLLVVAAFIAYKFIAKRRLAAVPNSDSSQE